MTQSLSIPLAWCVELKRLVTPQDILKQRLNHPDQQLSFLCPECDLPLIFHPHCSGIRAHAYFIRKSGQYHQSCIAKINSEHPLPQKLVLMQAFEDMFVRIANTQKELSSLHQQLAEICVSLCEELRSSCSSKELELLYLLMQEISQIKTANSLQQIRTTYLRLRKQLHGY